MDLGALSTIEEKPKPWRLTLSVRLWAGSTAPADVPKSVFDFSVLNQGSVSFRDSRGARKLPVKADSEGLIPLLVVGRGNHPLLPNPLTTEALKAFGEKYEDDYFVGYLVVP
jgi:hypothetical protein